MSKTPAPSPGPRARRPLPSLSSLCKEVISSKVDRYPPEALGVLSESEWDAIVKRRHRKTAPNQRRANAAGKVACTGNVIQTSITNKTGGLDGTGRLVPAISAPIMTSIEEACPHLRCSSIADDLVWKDCVEYKFRTGGPSRPRALQYPWDLIIARLKKSGQDLLELVKPPAATSEDTEEGGEGSVDASFLKKRERVLERSIKVMSDAPMSVPLLTSSGVGKAVHKFIKQCTKLRSEDGDTPPFMVDVWTERRVEGLSPASLGVASSRSMYMSPLEQLERLLQGWKNVASSSGVVVSKKNNSDAEDCSGRDKKTTAGQHSKDMKTLQTCKQWRDIHAALVDRESKMMENHGKLMRKIRENLNTDRPKISKLNFKSSGKREQRQEAILGGSRGARAMTAAQRDFLSSSRGLSSSSHGGSKIKQIRKESAIISALQGTASAAKKQSHPMGQKRSFSVTNAKTSMQRKPAPSSSSFADSVASANTSGGSVGSSGSKRKMFSGQRTLALRGGKQMKVPKNNRGGVFSSIQHKKEKKEERKRSPGSYRG